MSMYKSLKLNLVEADIFDSANALMKNIADDIETAFSGFDGEFEFSRPDGSTKNDIYGKPYITSVDYEITIGGIFFSFSARLDNVFNKGYAPEVEWIFRGHESHLKSFTVEDANKLVEATKIAWDLRAKILDRFNEFINANPFPKGGE